MLQMQTSAPTGHGGPPPGPPPLALGRIVITGVIILAAFFGTVGVWASIAPLQSAAIAPGFVSVDSKRKTIQHLEGGIVREIHVKEGDLVAAGDVLITLDPTRSRADLEITRNRMMSARARASRLVAERDGATEITWDDTPPGSPASQAALERQRISQQNEFTARKSALDNQVAILEQRSAQLEAEKSGIRSQIASQKRQIELLDDEAASMQRLFDKGLTGKTRLRELQRNLVEVKGQRSQNLASLSRIDQSITETRLQIADLLNTRLNEVLASLQETEVELRELEEREHALQDVLQRTAIVAPLGGMVLGLQVFTRGGVITPGAPLLDIVPQDDGLVVEARVDPVDIDVVHAGLDAMVRFVSFNQRNTQPTPARVLTVSADSLTDERTGGTYYLARVVLDEAGLAALDQAITPGMPVEVLIVTGERTPLEYFLQPITRSFYRAFRES